MWATGSKRLIQSSRRRGAASGFTLVELLVALAIAAVVLAVAVPSSLRMYDSMRYRAAVRDVLALFATARYHAVTSGQPQSVEVVPRDRVLRLAGEITTLPRNLNLVVHSARELNRDDTGVIRFYPDGGTSGGGVDIESDRGRGVSISVDWLMGGISQEVYAVR